MANRAFLVVTSARQVFPRLQQKKVPLEIVVCGEWRVPLLWFALFRPEDVQSWKRNEKIVPPFDLRAPLASRRLVSKRLAESAALLEAAIPKVKAWKDYLGLLAQAVEDCDADLKYVTGEWQEIATLDPPAFQAGADWLLKFFSGAKVQQPDQRLAELGDVKFRRGLPDVKRLRAGDLSEAEWTTVAALLGVEWERPVPWTPKPKKSKTANILRLISDRNADAIQRALAAKTPIPPGAVAMAASSDARILNLMLEAGGNPDDVSGLRGSALLAAFNSRNDVSQKVRALLDRGADASRHGLQHDRPFLLNTCLSHGMEFAKQIIAAADQKSLRQFTEWAATDNFRENVAAERLTWADEYVRLARLELAKRG